MGIDCGSEFEIVEHLLRFRLYVHQCEIVKNKNGGLVFESITLNRGSLLIIRNNSFLVG